jgi:hypothetical protein
MDAATSDGGTVGDGSCVPGKASLHALGCSTDIQSACASTDAAAVCLEQGGCPALTYDFECAAPCKAPAQPCCVHIAAMTAVASCGLTATFDDPGGAKTASQCKAGCSQSDLQACTTSSDCPASVPRCVPLTGMTLGNVPFVGNPILNVCLP